MACVFTGDTQPAWLPFRELYAIGKLDLPLLQCAHISHHLHTKSMNSFYWSIVKKKKKDITLKFSWGEMKKYLSLLSNDWEEKIQHRRWKGSHFMGKSKCMSF